MALPVNQQAKYWGIAAAVFFFVLWWLGDVILPFVLGGALAYMLDPLADRLERWGLSRAMAVVTITLSALLIVVLLFLWVIPLLVQQATALINSAPQMFQQLQGWLTAQFPEVMDADSTIRQQLLALGQTIQSKGGDLLNSLLSSAASLLSILLLVVIVPVVTFYLLLDWDRMIARVDELLPRDHAPVIRALASEIDKTLASFIRGQGTVCLILGTYYALGLGLVGLNFGLVLGFIAGMVSFIPYVGALIGGGLALGIALFQFWGQWVWIGAVGAVFFVGQMVEGNFLTPKLVGESVGLHPVWLLFALSVFGAIFGFVGLLVAVPMAAMIGVVIRFALGQYKTGRLYRGLSGGE
jgi:predicted PurR-regulated permease PerM